MRATSAGRREEHHRGDDEHRLHARRRDDEPADGRPDEEGEAVDGARRPVGRGELTGVRRERRQPGELGRPEDAADERGQGRQHEDDPGRARRRPAPPRRPTTRTARTRVDTRSTALRESRSTTDEPEGRRDGDEGQPHAGPQADELRRRPRGRPTRSRRSSRPSHRRGMPRGPAACAAATASRRRRAARATCRRGQRGHCAVEGRIAPSRPPHPFLCFGTCPVGMLPAGPLGINGPVEPFDVRPAAPEVVRCLRVVRAAARRRRPAAWRRCARPRSPPPTPRGRCRRRGVRQGEVGRGRSPSLPGRRPGRP